MGYYAIAALLLGAEKAVGVDIDPLAVKTARENGELNGFTPPVLTILHGDLVDKVEGLYDVWPPTSWPTPSSPCPRPFPGF